MRTHTARVPAARAQAAVAAAMAARMEVWRQVRSQMSITAPQAMAHTVAASPHQEVQARAADPHHGGSSARRGCAVRWAIHHSPTVAVTATRGAHHAPARIAPAVPAAAMTPQVIHRDLRWDLGL